MKRKLLPQTNNVLQQIEQKFQEYVQPTVITKIQFNKIFPFKRSVGEGSYGSIKCVENYYHETFALKQFKDNEQTYGVYRQVAIMKKFNHPNILKIIGFYKVKETQKLIILTQFCKFKCLKYFTPFLSDMSEIQKCRLALEIFNGIYALHAKNIMHRDLKPQNILIDQNRHAKICDFGFCRYDQEVDLSKTRMIGTMLYNSPETDKGFYTKKCDIFSYGLIVYFIFSNGNNLFKKFSTHQELKSIRTQHFKIGNAAYRQLNAPNEVKELLENAITEKEQNRLSTEQVRTLWEKIIKQKMMAGLIAGMLDEGSYNQTKYQTDKKRSDNKEQILSQSQLMIAQMIKREAEHQNEIYVTNKMLEISDCLSRITLLSKEFKQLIEIVPLVKIQKNILTFGCFLLLQLHLQMILTNCNILLSNKTSTHSKELIDYIQNLFGQITYKKKQFSTIIMKVSNYLQLTKRYLKSQAMINFLDKSFNQTKKLQNYLKQVCTQEGTQIYKGQNEISNHFNIYTLIKPKYKPQINAQQFGNQFNLVISNYRLCLQNDQKQLQRNKITQILDQITQIKIIKI